MKGPLSMKTLLLFLVLFSAAAHALESSQKNSPKSRTKTKEERTWEKAGFRDPTISSIEIVGPPNVQYTHQIDLHLVMFRRDGLGNVDATNPNYYPHTEWTQELVLQQMEKVARVFSQCGLKFGTAKFISVAAFHSGKDEITRPNSDRISKNTPIKKRPIIYFIGSADETYAGWAEYPNRISDLFGDTRNYMMNTAFITDKVITSKGIYYKDGKMMHKDPLFSITAHEVGHLLLNFDHVTDGSRNLMAEVPHLQSGELTAQQCETIRNNPLVKKLN